MTSSSETGGDEEMIRARHARRLAAFHALAAIDAQRIIAVVKWFTPLAQAVAAIAPDENAESYDEMLGHIALTQALDKASNYLALVQQQDTLEVRSQGMRVIEELAEALARRIGWRPRSMWREDGLYLLAQELP